MSSNLPYSPRILFLTDKINLIILRNLIILSFFIYIIAYIHE